MNNEQNTGEIFNAEASWLEAEAKDKSKYEWCNEMFYELAKRHGASMEWWHDECREQAWSGSTGCKTVIQLIQYNMDLAPMGL